MAGLVVGLALNLPATEVAGQGYVQVGIGAVVAAETRFADVDCESVTPAALYGCGVGGDGERLRSAGEFEAGTGLDLGAGYALRIELRAGYRPAVMFGGRAGPGSRRTIAGTRFDHVHERVIRVTISWVEGAGESCGGVMVDLNEPAVGSGMALNGRATGPTTDRRPGAVWEIRRVARVHDA